MKETGYFRSVESSYKGTREEIRFIPDPDRMTRFAMDNLDVGKTLRSAIQGDDKNIFKEHAEEYEINIELAEVYKQSILDIDPEIMLSSNQFPLSGLRKTVGISGGLRSGPSATCCG